MRKSILFSSLIAALTVAATLQSTSAPATSTSRGTTADQVDAPVPQLTWKACEQGLRCATAHVPLDYDTPNGTTTPLALAKHQATDPESRIATLFVNPGGPGDSAVDALSWYVDNLPDGVVERFDVVAIDPRGVGGSSPLRCRGGESKTFSWGYPITRNQTKKWLRYDRYVRKHCANSANPIIDHMTTADVARDMDLIRQAIGEQRLNFYGISYGSYLGATYAALFPDRIRAMSVDGVIDPIAYATGDDSADARTPVTKRWNSAYAAWESLTSAFAHCDRAGKPRCPIAGEATEMWHDVMNRLERGPAKVDGQRLRYQDMVLAANNALRGVDNLRGLMRLIGETHNALFGNPRERRGADVRAAYRKLRNADTTDTAAPIAPITEGVICADSRNPDDPRAWKKAAARHAKDAPWFGGLWTWRSSKCAQWPGSSADAYRGPFDADTSEPVLLIAETNDPATPFDGARRLNTLLSDSRLLTVQGWGHGALGESECVGERVEDYLVSQQLPAPGSVCHQDNEPFPER